PPRVRAGAQDADREAAKTPRARRDLGPADDDVLQERLELHVRGDQEVRLVRLREQQQALDDALDTSELVERDAQFRRPRLSASQELQVSTRDGHRRTQLVRRVVEEALLPLEERCTRLGELARVLE